MGFLLSSVELLFCGFMLDFDVVLEKDKSGQFFASVPALPGCYTYGDSVEEVLENIKDAIFLYFGSLS